ncbi:hypothetical protein CALCODRAFT_509812 [Calocera cornea HHB12733]|uniref:DUF6532 domain-containing protein n=1 Tax=Calocera cornea HHB12733 TaxID=1353952 RepID=A0A165EZ84_9BASI|nr:hypothetical protein CALCODRAFT_509812 [Calocera cornea HHB12733]
MSRFTGSNIYKPLAMMLNGDDDDKDEDDPSLTYTPSTRVSLRLLQQIDPGLESIPNFRAPGQHPSTTTSGYPRPPPAGPSGTHPPTAYTNNLGGLFQPSTPRRPPLKGPLRLHGSLDSPDSPQNNHDNTRRSPTGSQLFLRTPQDDRETPGSDSGWNGQSAEEFNGHPDANTPEPPTALETTWGQRKRSPSPTDSHSSRSSKRRKKKNIESISTRSSPELPTNTTVPSSPYSDTSGDYDSERPHLRQPRKWPAYTLKAYSSAFQDRAERGKAYCRLFISQLSHLSFPSNESRRVVARKAVAATNEEAEHDEPKLDMVIYPYIFSMFEDNMRWLYTKGREKTMQLVPQHWPELNSDDTELVKNLVDLLLSKANFLQEKIDPADRVGQPCGFGRNPILVWTIILLHCTPSGGSGEAVEFPDLFDPAALGVLSHAAVLIHHAIEHFARGIKVTFPINHNIERARHDQYMKIFEIFEKKDAGPSYVSRLGSSAFLACQTKTDRSYLRKQATEGPVPPRFRSLKDSPDERIRNLGFLVESRSLGHPSVKALYEGIVKPVLRQTILQPGQPAVAPVTLKNLTRELDYVPYRPVYTSSPTSSDTLLFPAPIAEEQSRGPAPVQQGTSSERCIQPNYPGAIGIVRRTTETLGGTVVYTDFHGAFLRTWMESYRPRTWEGIMVETTIAAYIAASHSPSLGPLKWNRCPRMYTGAAFLDENGNLLSENTLRTLGAAFEDMRLGSCTVLTGATLAPSGRPAGTPFQQSAKRLSQASRRTKIEHFLGAKWMGKIQYWLENVTRICSILRVPYVNGELLDWSSVEVPTGHCSEMDILAQLAELLELKLIDARWSGSELRFFNWDGKYCAGKTRTLLDQSDLTAQQKFDGIVAQARNFSGKCCLTCRLVLSVYRHLEPVQMAHLQVTHWERTDREATSSETTPSPIPVLRPGHWDAVPLYNPDQLDAFVARYVLECDELALHLNQSEAWTASLQEQHLD